ncbi:MAG: hypothetical protein QF682_12820 [Candidatus Thermoplasmatota archaeon]|jgi:hypothetical protein|nr:hypothetical protein [Candidatus Thermoplasmatota archaeon]
MGVDWITKGLSIGRVTDVCKSVTGFNISNDGKELLKEIAEEWIRLSTKRMEEATILAYPDAKTILDPENPQLSLNRVKGIMGEMTQLNQSAAAAITIKTETESLIKELIRGAAGLALAKNMRTIKRDHISCVVDNSKIIKGNDESEASNDVISMGIGQNLFMGNKELKHIALLYTKKRINDNAIDELREFLEEEMNETLFHLEEAMTQERYAEIKNLVQSIKMVIDQKRIRDIIRKADELADARGKKTIDVEELCDGFTRDGNY